MPPTVEVSVVSALPNAKVMAWSACGHVNVPEDTTNAVAVAANFDCCRPVCMYSTSKKVCDVCTWQSYFAAWKAALFQSRYFVAASDVERPAASAALGDHQ